MKKNTLLAVFILGIFISSAFVSKVEASTPTAVQIGIIAQLLQAFGTDQSIVNNVLTALGGSGTSGGGGGSSLLARLTVNGQTSATGVDPLLSRTWAWASSGGSAYKASAVISGCETPAQNGIFTNWTPWTTGSGTASNGSTSAVPGAAKYGCAIAATYTVTNSAGQIATANATVAFKHSTVTSGYHWQLQTTVGGCAVDPNKDTTCTASIVGTTKYLACANSNETGGQWATCTQSQTNGTTCTSFTYGTYGACQSNNTQTRTVMSSSPANCTGGDPTVSQSCTYTGEPQTKSCTGSHPVAENGVVLYDYTAVAIGGGGASGNTVWQYGASSCGWGCTFPTTQNGNIGCSPAVAGSGVTVTVNDLSTGQKVSGATITAGTISAMIGSYPAIGLGGGSGTFTTNSNGVTPEFLFQPGPTGSWTSIAVQVPSGYKTSKIRSASGCTERVYVNGGKQWDYCVNAVNKYPVTITLVPGDIATTPIVSLTKSSYTTGESLSGTVVGGDPNHTWGCIQRAGNTDPAATCTSGYSTPWRLLGSATDIAAGAAGWNLVSDNQGDRIVLQALPLASFPPDTYTMYVRTGTSALDSGGPSSHASATLTGAAPASAAANATTKSLVIILLGAGSGSIVSSSPDFVTSHNMGVPNESAQYTTTISNNAQVTLMGAPAGATITWTGCDSTSGGDGRNCIVTMSANRTVNATFTKI